MELKTNEDHKSMDLRAIRMDLAKKIGVTLTTGELVISLLSGCSFSKKDSSISTDPSLETIEEVEESSRIYDIPDHEAKEVFNLNPSIHLMGICDGGGGIYYDQTEITYEQLSNVTILSVYVDSDGEFATDDFDFLNYMPNLKSLSINDYAEGNHFDNIDGSRFSNEISINIIIDPRTEKFVSDDSYHFLRDIPSISELVIGSEEIPTNVDSDFLQSLHNVDNLELALYGFSNFHYQDLTHLSSLKLVGLPYDIAMFFSNKDLDALEKAGVELSGFSMDEVRDINNKIDDIVKSLNIDENATDQEKLNAILLYVLENYQYDPEISHLVDTDDERLNDEAANFYTEGEMTAGFENDTQICGNYAAITYTLGRRVGLDINMMTSNNHAWDVVKIGDYQYYTDPTWLDDERIAGEQKTEITDYGCTISFDYISPEDLLREGNQEELDNVDWYLEDPTKIGDIDSKHESHEAVFLPAGVELSEIPVDTQPQESDTSEQIEEEVETDTETKAEGGIRFNINGKVITVGLAAGVGILSALGIGCLVNKKQEEKRRREMERRSMFYSSIPYSSSSTYNSRGSSDYHRY